MTISNLKANLERDIAIVLFSRMKDRGYTEQGDFVFARGRLYERMQIEEGSEISGLEAFDEAIDSVIKEIKEIKER